MIAACLPVDASPPVLATVLIVDDDLGLVRLMEKTVRREGFATVNALSGEAAVAWLADHSVDLMLLDLKLPDMSGVNVLSQLDKMGRIVPFVVITGQGDERLAVELMRCGALDYLVKDAQFLEFLPAVVNRALTQLERQKRLEETEEELKKQHAFSSSVIDASGAIMLIADAAGRLVQWNRACEKTTGWSFEEMRAKRFWELLLPPDEADSVREGCGDPGSREYEGSLLTRSGEVRLITWSITTLRDTHGAVEFVIASGMDITERRRLEEDVILAKAAAASKELLFAMVSHELRTPLTPLLALVRDLGMDSRFSKEEQAAFAIMRRNLDLEVHLIDDLLDITRLTSGKLEFQFETVDLQLCLSSAIEICRNDLRAKGLHLSVDLAAGPHFVSADASRLHQVFWNLIKNAVKFTPSPGKITITSRCDKASQIIVEVRDTGIGMAADPLSHIFDPFFQVDSAFKQCVGGLGLGLAICKAITEAHGGTLTASSAGLGLGTTFRLILPAVAAPAAASSGEPEVHAPELRRQDLRLLLVEDHEHSRLVLTLLLRRRGYHVAPASNYAEACALCAEGRFDLLVTDLGLPGESGYEVFKELNSRYGLPGIAMSGFGSAPDLARGKQAGFLEYLVKPVDAETLDAAIHRVITGLA